MELILSLYPGIDVLGRAFAAAGYAVVLGPDLILDTRIESFHVPAGRFDGVIGGPPCQNYSDANRRRDTLEGDRLLREFLRVVVEAQPRWFLIENVRNVPTVQLPGWSVQRLDITDAACGGRQRRLRHIQFGHRAGWIIRPARTIGARPVTPAVLTNNDNPHDRFCRRLSRQGFDAPSAPQLSLRSFTSSARARAIGNAVPWRVSLALAIAVSQSGPVTPADCLCGCGRPITPLAKAATAACRKRLQRHRTGAMPRVVTLEP